MRFIWDLRGDRAVRWTRATVCDETHAIICQRCGTWLPLGPASIDERVEIEVRAAELAADFHRHEMFNGMEWYGRLDAQGAWSGIAYADLTKYDAHEAYRAGWLSEAIATHQEES